ncbi:MAG TPA: 2Fe-2S iron-sulfur cluster-binding protein [Polyangiaceae bacterium]
MPRRLEPLRDPVKMHFDGHAVTAERGEPVAVSLLAAGHLAIARSPKFHRPRGPGCLRAGCDGCLARVDDEPNVMTCRVPAADGMRIETQNVVGSRDTDLLRMADWFFPEGMNHHELFAGVPGVQRVMQALARRVAGLGRLPAGEAVPPREAHRRQVDALVVGAGPAGMSTAMLLVKKGRRVEVVDDALVWGGSVRALPGATGGPWTQLLESFANAVVMGDLRLRMRTTAAAVFGEDVLLAGEEGVEVATPSTLVIATGAHDGVLAFEGNDLPGVMSARAAGWIASLGVEPGERAVVALTEGGGPFGEACASAIRGATLVTGVPLRAGGSSRIKDVTVATASGERTLRCDALLVDAPRAPAYELAAQAGATLRHEPQGYVVETDEAGRIRPGIYAVGEVTGASLEPEAIARAAAAAVESI